MPESASVNHDPQNPKQQNAREAVNQSGGVDMAADNIQVGADVVGRDKIVQNIENYYASTERTETTYSSGNSIQKETGRKASANFSVSVSSRLTPSRVFWIFIVGLAIVAFIWSFFSGWTKVTEPSNVELSTTNVADYLTQMPNSSESPRANIVYARSGDTLPAVAQVYGVPLDTLSSVNRLPRNATLSAGQPLIVNIPDERFATLTPTILFSTPTPTVERRIYVVKEGDTISSIAHSFDVSDTDLRAINNLINGDLISIGQNLIIPDEHVTVQPSPTPIRPHPAVTATESIALGDAFVTIREISSGGDFAHEAVVLTNIGGKANVVGWTLSDRWPLSDLEGHRFTFPDMTVLPNAEVQLHTTSGTNTTTDLYWGQTSPLWGMSGTIAYLGDANSRLIATYRVP